ncbi:MAG: hypothetical protein IJ981_01315 [Clostridia bacterium]|nr:hypothetical protein [Clostridia bacterium]
MEKKNELITSIVNKATNASIKTAEEVKKGVKLFSEQTKKTIIEQRVKKYNPLFKEKFKSKEFKLPNIIEIVDDAVRRDIDVCEGAIGWTDKINGVEVLHLYDEFIKESKITFVPFDKCDAVYCVDSFSKNRFINVNNIFELTTNEKLAELEHIAYCLGAKTCSIEILESNEQAAGTTTKVSVKGSYPAGNIEANASTKNMNKNAGKNISYFEGNAMPKMPTLKWFGYDDNIKGLIDMRCSGNNTIKSKVLELSCSSSATMSQKTAIAIDKMIKTKAGMSMEAKSIREHSSRLVFEVQF